MHSNMKAISAIVGKTIWVTHILYLVYNVEYIRHIGTVCEGSLFIVR